MRYWIALIGPNDRVYKLRGKRGKVSSYWDDTIMKILVVGDYSRWYIGTRWHDGGLYNLRGMTAEKSIEMLVYGISVLEKELVEGTDEWRLEVYNTALNILETLLTWVKVHPDGRWAVSQY